MNERPLLPLPVLVLLALGWLAGLALTRWRRLRCRWPDLAGEWTALGLLAALNLAFFWRVLLTRDTWLPRGGGDFNSFYYPLYSFAARQLAAGHFPLWNPHLWSGMPFAADQQTGLFAPLNLLAFLVARPFTYGTLEWLVILQVWLASAFAYALCRDLGCRRVPALIGGITFAYSGFLVSHLGHYPMVAVAAWLPAVLLSLRRALRRASLGWTLVLAVTLLLAFLGGHPQIFLYLLVATGFYWLVLTWRASPPVEWPASGRQVARWLTRPFAWHWLRSAGQLGLAGGLAVGLAAPALLPSLELARLSLRAGLSYQESTAYALRPLHLLTLLLPNALGSTPQTFISALGFSGEVWGYAGVIALGLAALAVRLPRRYRRAETLFFGGLGLLALLVSLGAATPFQGWFYAFVPGFNRVRASGRWLLLVDFAVAMLAALGADGLLRLVARRRADRLRPLLSRTALALGALLGVGLLAVLILYGTLLAPRDPSAPLAQLLDSLVAFLALVALALGLVLALRSGRLTVRPAMVVLVGLVVLDLFAATAPIPPTNDDPLAGFRHDAALAALRAQPGPFRIDLTPLNGAWQPSWAAVAGLESVTGAYDPLGLARYNRYWDAIAKQPDQPRYDLLNARYVFAPPDKPLAATKFREVSRGKDYLLYENTAALPRAFLVGKAVPVASDEDAWNATAAADFDPRAAVYLEGAAPAFDHGAPNGTATVTQTGSDAFTVTVESDRDAMLVLSEVAYPGWRATVDGRPVAVLTADYTFRAVAVPAGRHEVRFVFTPPLWRVGWLLAAFSALLVAGLVVAAWVWRRRRPS